MSRRPVPSHRQVSKWNRFRPMLDILEAREVPTAGLQIIHNSPYEVAAEVDVYVNDAKASLTRSLVEKRRKEKNLSKTYKRVQGQKRLYEDD